MTIQPSPEDAFIEDVHYGYGDTRTTDTGNEHMTTDSAAFWAKHAGPLTPVMPRADGMAYRDSNRERGLPGALSEEWIAAHNEANRQVHRTDLYAQPAEAEAPVRTAPQSKYRPKPTESPTAYLARISIIARALDTLPEAERTAVSEAMAEAQARAAGENHDSLRTHLSTRAEGSAVGIFGNAEASLRAELGNRQDAANAQYRSNNLGYQGIATTVPRVDLHAARQAQENSRSAALVARYQHNLARPSGDGLL